MRLAYYSPLPPMRSGIADYSAELLPHLAAHCDIETHRRRGLPAGGGSHRALPGPRPPRAGRAAGGRALRSALGLLLLVLVLAGVAFALIKRRRSA